MRALVLLTLLALSTSRVAAARVIMRPSISRSCGTAAKWDNVRSCVARFGKMTVLRSSGEMRFIQVKPQHGEFGIEGFYLYVRHKGTWQLGGMLQGEGYTIESVKRTTLGKVPTWRIDASFAMADEIMTDDLTARASKIRSKVAVFCPGDVPSCAVVQTSCDVFVGGRLLWSFRGTLEVKDGMLHVRGDRARALDRCAQDEDVFVPEPANSMLELE